MFEVCAAFCDDLLQLLVCLVIHAQLEIHLKTSQPILRNPIALQLKRNALTANNLQHLLNTAPPNPLIDNQQMQGGDNLQLPAIAEAELLERRDPLDGELLDYVLEGLEGDWLVFELDVVDEVLEIGEFLQLEGFD